MTQSHREQYGRDGYLVVPGVIPQARMAEWRDFITAEFDKFGGTVINETAITYPRVRELIDVPQLRECLAEVLGSPFVLVPHHSIARHGFGAFHTDTTGAEMSGNGFHRLPDFRIVTVVIYLQDNFGGGGISLVPGSHLEPDPYVKLTAEKAALRKLVRNSWWRRLLHRFSGGRIFDWDKKMRDHPRARAIETRAGDCVLWDMRMIHCATPQAPGVQMPPGGKYAIFFTIAASNPTNLQAYLDYMYSVPGNAHLKEFRSREGFRLPDPTKDYSFL